MHEINYFLHITKTAGGSIKALLKQNLSEKAIFHNGHSNLPSIDSSIDVIFGHFLHDLHENYPDFNHSYSCFLRNPVNRVISHYHHLYNVDQSKVGNKIRNSGKDINEYFLDYNHWEFSNAMCKIIAGIKHHEQKWTDETILTQAIENLRKFKFIGIFELMQLSMFELSKKYNLDISNVPKVNIGNYKMQSINDDTIKEIKRINRYDIILYKFAIDQFLKRL